MRVFEEKQWFNQWWVHLITIGLTLQLLYFIYSWYGLKEATGNVSANDITGQLIVMGTFLVCIPLIYIFKLNTYMDEHGIHYQFFPIHRKKEFVRWNELQACYVRKYSPLKEYGGWGYRIGSKGKALNVKGKQGIQLVFEPGNKLLIGTQKPEEAQQVIDKYFEKNKNI